MKSKIKAKVLVSISVLGLFQAGAAYAQDRSNPQTGSATDDSAPKIDDIIVQARRADESQQRVPVAISTVSGDRLTQAAATSVDDIQRLVPSLRIATGSTGQVDFNIRGSFTGFGVDPAVITYVDEVPIDSRAIAYDVFDLASVQELKGPQGTLFGRNSTGGAVLFVSRRPEFNQFSVDATLRYANLNELRAEGAVNIPFTDGLALRLSGEVDKRDGQLRSVTVPGLDFNNRDNAAVRGSLLWRPSDVIEEYLQGTHYRVRENRYPQVIDSLQTNCTGPTTPALACLYQPPFNALFGTDDLLAPYRRQLTLPTDETVATDPTFNYVDRNSVTNSLTVHLGGVNLRNISYYGKVKLLWSRDFDGTAARVVDSSYTSGTETVYSETQLFGTLLGDHLSWRVGGVYSQDKGDQTQRTLTFPSPFSTLVTPQSSRAITDFRSYALFGQASYDVSDWLRGVSLTAGYRYTWDNRSITSTVFGGTSGTICQLQQLPLPAGGAVAFPGTDLATCTRTLSNNSSDSNYNLSVDWKPTDKVLVFATFSRGYKAGSFNTFVVDPTLATYDPETVNDIEFGVKADWRVGTVPIRTNVTLFRSKYTNIQTSTVAITPAGAVQVLVLNRDPATGLPSKATIKGLEAEVTVAPTRWLQLSGFFSLIEAKYDRFVSPSSGVDISGQDLENRFPRSYGVTAQTDIPLGGPGRSLVATLSYFGTSAPTRNALTSGLNPSQEQLDGRIALRHLFNSDLDLSFFAKNITGTRKCGENPLVQGSLTQTCSEPRTYGLELRIHLQ